MTRFHFLDSDKIYTDGFFSDFILHTVPLDREEKSSFFRRSERFYGTSVTFTCSVFDLKKDGYTVLFCDNINLSPFGCDKVGFDNLVPVFLEILDSEKFCLIARFSTRVCHKNDLSFLRRLP